MAASHFEKVETELLWFDDGVSKTMFAKQFNLQLIQYLYQSTDGADTKTSYQIKQPEACSLRLELTMEGKFVELKYYRYSMHPLDVAVVATLTCTDE